METLIQNIANFLDEKSVWIFMLRIAFATFCGALVGLERTKRSKEAGIRTHTIIAAASALIMIISKYGFADLALAEDGAVFAASRGVDPASIAAQIVSGISFLGAGVIFRNGNTVKGLTTAAGIWATAAIGMACGSGMYTMAIVVTLLIVAVQLLMHHFSVGNDAYSTGEIRIVMVDTPEIRKVLKEKQEDLGITVVSSRITCCGDNTINLILQVRMKNAIPFDAVMKFVDQHPEIKSLSI
jgi:putative Mg2+ transporter-C (MgtC) family protein